MAKSIILSLTFLMVFQSNHFSKENNKQQNEIVNVFILAGQSNALGQHLPGQILSNLPLAYQSIQDSIFVWRKGNYSTSDTPEGFENMRVPFNTRDKRYNDPSHQYHHMVGWSVEQEWLHRALTYFKQKVYFIKNAYGGYGINNWSKNGGKMYEELSEMILKVDSTFTASGKTVKFRGMVWMQGEADANTFDYHLKLDSLIRNIRQLSVHTSEIPFIIVKIPEGTLRFSYNVDNAYRFVVQNDSLHNFLLDPTGMPGITFQDNLHYDDSSKLILGGKIFEFQLNRNQLR